MSRSVKKGPYVAAKLLKRVEEMNESGKKSVLKTWSRAFVKRRRSARKLRTSVPARPLVTCASLPAR